MPASRLVQVEVAASATRLISVGPIPAEHTLESITLQFPGTVSAQSLNLAFALTSNRLQAAADLASGQAILDSGDTRVNGQPQIQFTVAGATQASLVLRPLITLSSGPKYLSIVATEPVGFVDANVIIEIIYSAPGERPAPLTLSTRAPAPPGPTIGPVNPTR